MTCLTCGREIVPDDAVDWVHVDPAILDQPEYCFPESNPDCSVAEPNE